MYSPGPSSLLGLVALNWATVTLAGVCDSGIYANLAPLKSYPPAASFCAARYPPGTVTTVTSVKKERDPSAFETVRVRDVQRRAITTSSKKSSSSTTVSTKAPTTSATSKTIPSSSKPNVSAQDPKAR